MKSGEKVKVFISEKCPLKLVVADFVFKSHNLIFPSAEALAKAQGVSFLLYIVIEVIIVECP